MNLLRSPEFAQRSVKRLAPSKGARGEDVRRSGQRLSSGCRVFPVVRLHVYFELSIDC